VQGGAAEGWWGGGGSFPLPSQHHTPLPSSDATTADPASTIADPTTSTIAVADAALAIGSAFADPDIAVAGAALPIGSAFTDICRTISCRSESSEGFTVIKRRYV
jgi:hypothetical protein